MVLTKAWDKEALVAELKAQGLPVAEVMVEKAVESILSWVEASVMMSEDKYDDFAVPIMAALKPFIMGELNKIDGVEG